MGQSTRLPLHVRAYTLGCREPKKASQKGDPLGEVKEDKKGDGAKSDELDDEAGRGFLQAGRTTQVPYGRLLVVYMPSTGAPGGPTRSRSANRLSGEKLHSAQIRRDDCPFPASCQRSRWAAPGDVLSSSPSPDRVWWPDRYVGHVAGSKKP